ncbi:MAG: hypothetical protein JXR51_07730 [Bacteroidales bacterium]|nr:hypothetical protein [Bacteroidales bacterium]MBN2757049.1 hypothetical protein [Bacteroidales bacterium]
MDINQLFSFQNNKEVLTKDSIEKILSILEESPYFQAAHMLLLKSLYINKSEKYNNQLKISGTYLSNKSRLFQFINESAPKTSEIEVKTDITKETIIEKESKIEIKDDTKIEIKEKTAEEKIKDLKEKNLNKKRDVELNSTLEKSEEKKTIEEPEIKISIAKTGKSRLVNPEVRHKKIINDFFTSSKTIKKAEITKDKIEPIIKEKTEQSANNDGKTTAKSLFEDNLRRKERLKENETKKTIPLKEDKIQIKKETVENNTIEKAIANQPEIEKKIESPNLVIEKQTEKKIEAQTTKNQEVDKEELTINKNDNAIKVSPQSDAMSNIFSKIRAIKKEMNIDSPEENTDIIDINKRETPKRRLYNIADKEKTTTDNVDKKSDKDIFEETTEAIDPFNQNIEITTKVESKIEKKEIIEEKQKPTLSEKPDKEETIKETTLTAKDLFNQHLKKKALSTIKDDDKKESAIVNYVDEHKEEKTSEIEKENAPLIVEKKVEEKILTQEKPVEKISLISETKNESAADALLRKIALKKQRMKEEEEQKKLEKTVEYKEEIIEEKAQAIEEKNKTEEKNNIEEQDKEFELDEKKKNSIAKIKNANNIITNQSETTENENRFKKDNLLIDKFINKAENLERLSAKESKLKGDVSISSTIENDEIITESIADLYVQQKHYTKAIAAYNKLILKFPEKKTYFAIQIKKVESLI